MEETYCYIGIKKCGCVVSACADRPEYKNDTAKFIAEQIRDGLTIERVSSQDARNRLQVCECQKQAELFEASS